MDLEESAEAIQAVWTGKDVSKLMSQTSLKHTNNNIMYVQSILHAGDTDYSIRQVH